MWQGRASSSRLILGLAVVTLVLTTLATMHGFLALNRPVPAELLVIEAWISHGALVEAAGYARRNAPHTILLVDGSALSQYPQNQILTSARHSLIGAGVSDSTIVSLNALDNGDGRTYACAQAVRAWIRKSPQIVTSLNVFTQGVHARKSYAVYARTFEPRVKVGVLSAQTTQYDPRFWWASSTGLKWVVFDFAKYVRAALTGR